MTIDEITTALKEWRGDNGDKHYLLIAVDDEELTVAVPGNDFLLGAALASAINAKKETERVVQWAMTLKAMDLFNDQGDDTASTE